jgi:hypothetical protein
MAHGLKKFNTISAERSLAWFSSNDFSKQTPALNTTPSRGPTRSTMIRAISVAASKSEISQVNQEHEPPADSMSRAILESLSPRRAIAVT